VTRVLALLAQATSIGDIVSVEAELARREADLDSLQRRLAALKDRVALSTLTVELRTAPGPVPATPPPGFGAGLDAGWSGLMVIGSGLATATGFLLPFLPVLAVAAVVVWAVVRRRRAARRRGGPGPEGESDPGPPRSSPPVSRGIGGVARSTGPAAWGSRPSRLRGAPRPAEAATMA
jgi:hypothetical protein